MFSSNRTRPDAAMTLRAPKTSSESCAHRLNLPFGVYDGRCNHELRRAAGLRRPAGVLLDRWPGSVSQIVEELAGDRDIGVDVVSVDGV
jgi:hypothetical protein